VRITNRNAVSITHRYPEIVERLESLPFEGTLDGEIICLDAAGRPDFARVHRRDAQSSPSAIRRLAVQSPAVFVPFDVLNAAGEDVRELPYTARRERLLALWPGQPGELSVSTQNPEAMWAFVLEQNLEGLVAKSGSSRYTSGRSKNWVKIKATKRASVLVSSIATDRAALEMVVWDGAELVSVGSVGSGMTDRDWRTARKRVMAGGLAAGDPVVIEVEYLEVARGRQLRQPVFRGFRTDVSPEDCTVERLRG
jgi:bifunctional non-homologous end joining protein LigD